MSSLIPFLSRTHKLTSHGPGGLNQSPNESQSLLIVIIVAIEVSPQTYEAASKLVVRGIQHRNGVADGVIQILEAGSRNDPVSDPGERVQRSREGRTEVTRQAVTAPGEIHSSKG